jgi:hypothetical protein
MEIEFDFLTEFPKDNSDLYICYDVFTFNQLFKLLLNEGLNHSEVMAFILAHCSLSATVFQIYIHNKKYLSIKNQDILSPFEASRKAKMYADFVL